MDRQEDRTASGAAHGDYEKLLLSLHGGPADLRPWEAFLRQLSTSLRSSYANIVFRQPDGKSVLSELAFGDEDILAHRRRYEAIFPPMPSREPAMLPGRSYRLHELLAAEPPSQRAYYREFMEPAGLHVLLIAHLVEESGYRAWLSVARRKDTPDFTAEDQALFDSLLPHMATALRNFAQIDRHRIRAAVSNFISARFELAAITVSEEGRILGMEPAARAILDDAKEVLSDRHGRLAFARRDLQQRLTEALVTAASGQRSRAVVFTVGEERVELLVQPFLATAASASVRPAAVIYFHRDRPFIGREEEIQRLLTEMYDLTPMESSIALGIARGRTMAQLAGDLALTENTIRSYSRTIYPKLGVSRQVDLARVVLTSLARLA